MSTRINVLQKVVVVPFGALLHYMRFVTKNKKLSKTKLNLRHEKTKLWWHQLFTKKTNKAY